MNEKKNPETGALVALIIIVLILIIGGYYSFTNRLLRLENTEPATGAVEIQPTMPTSTESIEQAPSQQ